MSGRFDMTGIAGEVRVGGRVAARLGRWSLSREGETWTVTAVMTEADDYWLASDIHPMTLRLDVGSKTWRFKDVRIERLDPLTVAGESRPDVL